MIIIDYSQIAISNILNETRGHKIDYETSLPLIRHMILNTIRAIRHRFFHQYGEVVIACDNWNYWRKQEFPYYKQNRKASRDQTIDWDALYKALNTIKNELKVVFPYPVIDVPHAEADDIIYSLVQWSLTHDTRGVLDEEPKPVLIVSGDKDFLQLQRWEHVDQYSVMEKKLIYPENGIDRLLLDHILGGDKGDGIPNVLSDDDVFMVQGKRQKSMTAKARSELYAMFGPNPTVTPSEELQSKFDRNKKLIDLREVPKTITEQVWEQYEQQKETRNRSQMMDYFTMHNMKNLIGYITQF